MVGGGGGVVGGVGVAGVVGSPDSFSSKIHPRYVTFECCLIFIFPWHISNPSIFFLFVNNMLFVLSSPK